MRQLICGLAIVLACSFAISGCSRPDKKHQIRMMVQRQANDWNKGDIPGFMDGYWRSEELTFASGGDIERGWQATLDRFERRYPTTEDMGQLAFELVNVELLSDDSAMVLGRWSLTRTGGNIGGVFTLVLRRISGQWRIVHDHTSVATSDNVES